MLYFWIILLVLEAAFGAAYLAGSPRERIRAFFANPVFARSLDSLLRIGIGGMFLFASWPKILSPYAFSNLIAQYQLLPAFAVHPFALFLPMLEAVSGAGLIATKWKREFGFLVLVMMGLFLIALGQALARDLGIVCGCFDIEGAVDKSGAWHAFLRDLALLPLVAWLWKGVPNRYLWQISGDRPGSGR